MSLWERVRSLLGAERREPEAFAAEGRGAEEEDAPDTGTGEPASPERDPLERESAKLLALAARTAPGSEDQAIAIEAFETLCAGGREVQATELARRVLAGAAMPELRCRVAERLDARGDQDEARVLLAPLLRASDAPLDGLMLAGEIAERRGAARDALSIYERIVARDVSYPRARERVARLREKEGAPRRDVGATLVAEGALARGRFKLLRELGRGGAGTIFLAEDTELGRHVALKVYHRRGRADRERLLQESRTAASMEHPGVIRVLEVEESLGAIAMEVIEHGSIRHWLSRGAIPPARLRPWLASAVDALGYVHGRGVVHRDLKPSNMLLRSVDRVVLADFGIAERLGHAASTPSGEGTLAYMPPEQRAGAPSHPSMDVHALGATLGELLGQLDGQPPAVLVELSAACVRTDPRSRPTLDHIAAVVSELPPT